MIEIDQIYNEDCLEGMKRIDDGTVDCIITDLPYGTTGLKWDCPIPADKLWEQYRRIIKPDGAIVLFCQQPFTTALIASNIEMWKYNWIWEKEMGTNFINCNYCPLKVSEDIAVFSKAPIAWVKSGERMKYNPQMSKGKPYVCTNGNSTDKAYSILHSQSQVCGHVTVNNGERYPTNILRFIRDRDKLHPTQKPVALLRYLVLTYTDVGGGSFGLLHGQRHHRHRLSEGASALPRLRAEQGILRHRSAAHRLGASAAAVGLYRRLALALLQSVATKRIFELNF